MNKTYGSKIENIIEDFDVSSQDLQLNYSIRKGCISLFWQTWSEEYLKSLPCVISKPFHKRQIKVGDLVLIRNENKAKIFWPMGVITQTFLSEDGACRSDEIKTKNGFLKRSVNNLHQLEVSSNAWSKRSDNIKFSNSKNTSSHVRLGNLNESIDMSNNFPNISEECRVDHDFLNPQDFAEGTDEAVGVEAGHLQDTAQSCHDTDGHLQDTDQDFHNPENSSEMDLPRFTRRGRKIKPPQKLNL